jgi:hypothetical protein
MKEAAKMIDINDHLKSSIARVEQLENQRKLKERREQEARKKIETRRHFDFGRLVCKYFPDEDIAAFENLLRALKENAELYAKLKEKAAKYTLLS